MRVLLSSKHRYPAYSEIGNRRHPMDWPSGSGFLIHDLIARGLSEAGHQVFYLLSGGASQALPPGVMHVSEPVFDVDILHCEGGKDKVLVRLMEEHGVPWVSTCHLDPRLATENPDAAAPPNWIFVSRTLARSLGRARYVWNGLDPAALRYSESKDDYILFVSSLERAEQKGLTIALHLAKSVGLKLMVAGTAKNWELLRAVEKQCQAAGAEFLGDVRGNQKADLFARARGLLFPTQINEAFGLVMVEALLSGTPVICSNKGACPELISPETGFVCETEDDYLTAFRNIHTIRPRACRDRALTKFHYRTMAEGYVAEYAKELDGLTARRE